MIQNRFYQLVPNYLGILESVTVNKNNLTLIGNDSGGGLPVVRCELDSYGFTLKNDSVKIENFILENLSVGGVKAESDYNNIKRILIYGTLFSRGIHLENSSYNNITGSDIKNTKYGIYLIASHNNNISGNVITNAEKGIYIGKEENPKLLYSGNYNKITNNTISGPNKGIEIGSSLDNIIKDNNINTDGYGIYIKECNSGIIENNRLLSGIYLKKTSELVILKNNIETHKKGIYLEESNLNVIISNNINKNNVCGICLQLSDNNTIVENNITENNNGVHLCRSNNNTLTENTIKNNTIGLNLTNSGDNIIYFNNFLDNTNRIFSNSNNKWNSTSLFYLFNNSKFRSCLGNYWSDNHGLDNDSDGIGDTEYIVNASSQEIDCCPLIEPTENFLILKSYGISGTVQYEGALEGIIWIQAFLNETEDKKLLNSISIDSPGTYVIQLPNGTYNIRAFMDKNGNQTLDIDEPSGHAINKRINQTPDLIEVNGTGNSSIDITLYEDEMPPILNINIHPLFVILNFNGTSYEVNSTEISFNVTDNTQLRNATLEIWNSTAFLESKSYNTSEEKYLNSTKFNISQPGTYRAILKAWDVWNNLNISEEFFYAIGKNDTSIFGIKGDIEFKAAKDINVSLVGDNVSLNLTIEDSSINETFNVSEIVSKCRYLNISGNISGNISQFSIAVRYSSVQPFIYIFNKTLQKWTDITGSSCIKDDEANKSININLTCLAESKDLNAFLSDPVFALPIAPDLTVDDINLNSDNRLVITISNVGNNDSIFNVSIIVDGEVKENRFLHLNAFNNTTITSSFKLSSGDHTVTVKVDPEDKIEELNESNNEMSKNITVPSPSVEGSRRGGGGGGGGGLSLPIPTNTSTPEPTPKRTISLPSIPISMPKTTPMPEETLVETPEVTPTPEETYTPEPTPVWWEQPTGSIAISVIAFSAILVIAYLIRRG